MKKLCLAVFGVVIGLTGPQLALAAIKSGMAPVERATAGGLLQVTLGLLVVVGAIIGGAWMLRRFGHIQNGAHGNIKVVGGVSMGARERVVLLQVGETQLLLGVAPGRIQTLHVLDKPVAVNQSNTGGGGFAGRLAELLKQRGGRD